MSKEDAHLPRLEGSHYTGPACIHWTFTVQNRATGWLDDHWHLRFREILLHACHRQPAIVPVYCLMPDHIHLLLLGKGNDDETDHQRLVRFLRRQTNSSLLRPLGFAWQKQAHDHVLRDHERERGAFEAVANYILENTVRADLVESPEQWEYSGAQFPGYPDLNPHGGEEYWELFWRLAAR